MTILFDLYHKSEHIGYADLSDQMPYILTLLIVTPKNNFTHLNLTIPPLMQLLGLPFHWVMTKDAQGTASIDEGQTATPVRPPENRIYSFLEDFQSAERQKKISFLKNPNMSISIQVKDPILLFQALIQFAQNIDFFKQVLTENAYKIIPQIDNTSKSVDQLSFSEKIKKELFGILKKHTEEILQDLYPQISEHWKFLFEIIKKNPLHEFNTPRPDVFIRSLQLDTIKNELSSKTLSNLNLFSLWGIKYYEHGYSAETSDPLQTQKKETLINICSAIEQSFDILKLDDILPRDDHFTSGSFSRIRELCLRHLAHEFYTNRIEDRYKILCIKAAKGQKKLSTIQHSSNSLRFYEYWEELHNESIELIQALENLTAFPSPPSIENFNYQKNSPPAWEAPSNIDGVEALRQANLRLPQTSFEKVMTSVAAPLSYVYNALPELPPALASIPTPTSAARFFASWWN